MALTVMIGIIMIGGFVVGELASLVKLSKVTGCIVTNMPLAVITISVGGKPRGPLIFGRTARDAFSGKLLAP